MAGKPKRMSQIKQLLRLKQLGRGIKSIAKDLGISKNTVKSYLYRASSTQMSTETLLELDDPVLESKLLVGNPSYKKDERYEQLKNKFKDYTPELEKVGVTRKILWDEYRQSSPLGYSYTQFCYHFSQHLKAAKPSMVLQHQAGEKLYIDFAGKKLGYIDPETGELIECQVFVACLPYSDYSFAMAVRTQTIEDFIHALTCCLEAIGGVPQTLVPDNLKAAIVKANNYEPDVNRVLEDFANHYNTTVTPARARKPKDKALVENQVKLIYSRVYAKLRNQQFFDLDSLNQAIFEKVKEHNQTRMQQRDYCREEKFLSDEKNKLKILPPEKFEIKYYKTLKVAKNNHIYLSVDKHYYSVPYAYIGQKSSVIFTRSIVKIYISGKQVAAHPRIYKAGKYSTVKEHLCSHHQYYLDRSPEYYRTRAGKESEEFYELVNSIFTQDKYPEQLYRTCDGLFNLQRKTEAEKFTAACRIAIENNNYSYHFIHNIIENKMVNAKHEKQLKLSLPQHENTRGARYYS
jgi:transposase